MRQGFALVAAAWLAAGCVGTTVLSMGDPRDVPPTGPVRIPPGPAGGAPGAVYAADECNNDCRVYVRNGLDERIEIFYHATRRPEPKRLGAVGAKRSREFTIASGPVPAGFSARAGVAVVSCTVEGGRGSLKNVRLSCT